MEVSDSLNSSAFYFNLKIAATIAIVLAIISSFGVIFIGGSITGMIFVSTGFVFLLVVSVLLVSIVFCTTFYTPLIVFEEKMSRQKKIYREFLEREIKPELSKIKKNLEALLELLSIKEKDISSNLDKLPNEILVIIRDKLQLRYQTLLSFANRRFFLLVYDKNGRVWKVLNQIIETNKSVCSFPQQIKALVPYHEKIPVVNQTIRDFNQINFTLFQEYNSPILIGNMAGRNFISFCVQRVHKLTINYLVYTFKRRSDVWDFYVNENFEKDIYNDVFYKRIIWLKKILNGETCGEFKSNEDDLFDRPYEECDIKKNGAYSLWKPS